MSALRSVTLAIQRCSRSASDEQLTNSVPSNSGRALGAQSPSTNATLSERASPSLLNTEPMHTILSPSQAALGKEVRLADTHSMSHEQSTSGGGSSRSDGESAAWSQVTSRSQTVTGSASGFQDSIRTQRPGATSRTWKRRRRGSTSPSNVRSVRLSAYFARECLARVGKASRRNGCGCVEKPQSDLRRTICETAFRAPCSARRRPASLCAAWGSEGRGTKKEGYHRM